MMPVERFIFLGPPGAGKGTQAARVSDELGVPHVSTGDILRAAVRDDTDLGRKANSFMERGELVPDDVMAAVVASRLSEPDCRDGYVLDGFPRTIAQDHALKAAVGEDRVRVIYFDLSEEQVVERLTGRRVCPECGATYHVRHLPSAEPGRCDRCGATLVQRSDDAEPTVRERLRVYREQTEGLVELYRERGELTTVDASGTPDEVHDRLIVAMREGL